MAIFELNGLTHCWHLSNHDAAEGIGDTAVKESNKRRLMLFFWFHLLLLRQCSLLGCLLSMKCFPLPQISITQHKLHAIFLERPDLNLWSSIIVDIHVVV